MSSQGGSGVTPPLVSARRSRSAACTLLDVMTSRRAAARANQELGLDDQGSLAAGVFSALPDILLAGFFVFTWVNPLAFDTLTVKRLTALTLLEFIVMHSAPFSGLIALSPMARKTKVFALLGLGCFYMLFAYGFAKAFDSSWPVYSFVGLMLNRLLGVVVGAVPRGAYAGYLTSCWIVGALTYLLAIAFAAVAPLPRLGVTPEVVAAQHFVVQGLWPEQPHRALAFGAIYFGVVAVWEIVGRGIIIKRVAARARKQSR